MNLELIQMATLQQILQVDASLFNVLKGVLGKVWNAKARLLNYLIFFVSRFLFGRAWELQGTKETLWASRPHLPLVVNQGILLWREEIPLHVPLLKHVRLATASQHIIGVSLSVTAALVDSGSPQIALIEGPTQVLSQKALPSFLVIVGPNPNQLLLNLGSGFTVD